jgi:DDE superfamily endonuclease
MPSEQDREDVKAAREAWFEAQPDLDPERLIFLDKTGLNTKMARLRPALPARRAPPHGRPARTLADHDLRRRAQAQRTGRPDADRRRDERRGLPAYVQRVLVPALRPGDVVVMDNLRCHKGAAVRVAIEAAGAELRFLPPYSPISTRSRSPSRSSRLFCARPPAEPVIRSGAPSPPLSMPSVPPSAPTSSPPPDTSQSDGKML